MEKVKVALTLEVLKRGETYTPNFLILTSGERVIGVIGIIEKLSIYGVNKIGDRYDVSTSHGTFVCDIWRTKTIEDGKVIEVYSTEEEEW